MKKVFQEYRKQQRSKFIKVMTLIINKVSNGQLILSNFGFWESGVDNSIFFRIKLISRDSSKEIKNFEKIS